jgi:hypothetical protein
MNSLKAKNTIILLFLDFHKAFDLVKHTILLSKLSNLGICGKFHSVLKSYLCNRTQKVKIHNTYSPTLSVNSGVPQGSILAPTLFQIFIDDLLSLPLYSTSHAYADDTTFTLAGRNLTLLQSQLSHDLNLISDWCSMNAMTINVKKSHYLAINLPDTFTLSLRIADSPLLRRSTSKLLGFHVNDKLTWHDHINDIINKAATNLRLFHHIRHLLNFDTSKQFYQNFIHSYLIYGIYLYYPLSPKSHTDPLFLLQKQALRTICKKGNHTPCRTLSTKFTCHQANILPLPDLAKYFACITAHRILNNHSPPYILGLFNSQQCTRYNTRNHRKLPSSQKYNKLNLFIVTSFNNLPKQIRTNNSYQSFKHCLKRHYLSNL